MLQTTITSLLRDALDRQIVALLVENARLAYREIGERVGLSAPAVKRRMDRLERDGVIVGYTAIVDPQAPGQSTEAFVELWCRGKTSPTEVRAIVADVPQVIGAYTVSGDADALLHMRTRDSAELESAIERIRANPNAERTKTVIVLSRLLGPEGRSVDARPRSTRPRA
jgi:DNA-binding Lrp family transcriptional regulator